MIASTLGALSLLWAFGSVTIQSYICQPPTPPAITSPAAGTTVTSSTVQVSGDATSSSQVTLAINGRATVQTTADNFRHFAAQLPLASSGMQTISVSSVNPCGNANGNSVKILVLHLSSPSTQGSSGTPVTLSGGSTASSNPGLSVSNTSGFQLIIKSPHEGLRTTAASVFTSGTTSEPASIHLFVNGREVAQTLTTTTAYGLSTPLQLGNNTITVKASSEHGSTQAQVNVTRLPVKSAGQQAAIPVTPWWHTTPGKILITSAAILVLGLFIWLQR